MNDNYIALINRFWSSSIEHAFNTSDCMLYFYLLNTCNALHWKQPFGQSDRHLSLMLGISIPTVRMAKIRLRQRGLIGFKAPVKASKAYGGQTKFHFPNTQKNNVNVEIQTRKSILPYSSQQFAQAWNKLLETTKWKEKPAEVQQATLDKLKDFDEEFSIRLIESATTKQWSGVIYPETAQKYQQWKKQKENGQQQQTNTGKNNDSDKRKTEIRRRANDAIAACEQ